MEKASTRLEEFISECITTRRITEMFQQTAWNSPQTCS